ncbi:MAG TPA: tetratricopeptide repeat protein [Nitrososphaeraceae archaeon]|nr:tetratricopeptide repeat protein [Nitrososphaeraceae archaeon]
MDQNDLKMDKAKDNKYLYIFVKSSNRSSVYLSSFFLIILTVFLFSTVYFSNNESYAQITSFISDSDATTKIKDKSNTTNQEAKSSFEAANKLLLSNPIKAIELYNKAISLDPNWAAPYLNKGNAISKQGNSKGAHEQFDKAISLDPNWAAPLMDKGNILFKQKNFTNAIELYNKAISLDPNWAAPYLNKGNTLFKLGNYSGAIESYDKAISLLGNLDEQIKSLDKTQISLLPYWINVWLDKGEALYKLERFDESLAVYDKLISLDPKWANPWNSKGWALHKLDKNNEAVAAFDEAIKLDPTWSKPWNSKGWVLYKLAKFEEALSAFDKAISLEPKWDKPWFNKGKVYYDLDKFPEAKQFLEHALSLNPKDPKTPQLIETINTKMAQAKSPTPASTP